MNNELRESMGRSGWENETNERQESVKKFISDHMPSVGNRSEYDHSTEMHFSGMNPSIVNKIREGVLNPSFVNVLYEMGEPKQLHVVFEAEEGQNIDVYLTDKALKDYLEN